MTLVLHRGLPGSGKSTAAKKLVAECGYSHFENDMYFMKDGRYVFDQSKHKEAMHWCFNSVKHALESGKDVVVSNVFVSRGSIMQYMKLAKACKADFIVKRFCTEYGNVHDVPKNVIDSMKSSFQDWRGEIKIF